MITSEAFVLSGLILNTVGAVVIIRRSAFMYVKSWFSKEAKGKIMEEAISTHYARVGGAGMENDPFVRGYVATFRSSFWGFLMIVAGFVARLVGKNPNLKQIDRFGIRSIEF